MNKVSVVPDTAVKALVAIAGMRFGQFDEHDFATFSGVESEEALISYGEKFTAILDGETVSFYSNEDTSDWSVFLLGPNANE